MNTLKNINFERTIARRLKKRALRRPFPREHALRCPRKVESRQRFSPDLKTYTVVQVEVKPAKTVQPTLIRMKTARSLAYLEDRKLATFKDCKLIVIIPSWHNPITGVQSAPHSKGAVRDNSFDGAGV